MSARFNLLAVVAESEFFIQCFWVSIHIGDYVQVITFVTVIEIIVSNRSPLSNKVSWSSSSLSSSFKLFSDSLNQEQV